MKATFVCPLCYRQIQTSKPDPYCDRGHIPIEMDGYIDDDALIDVGCGCG